MTRSFTTIDKSSLDTQPEQTRVVLDGDEADMANKAKAANILPRGNQELESRARLASAWNEALCCEARNSLQVILSGAEILLEDHLGNLLAGQKELLTKMSDNTYHLCNLLSALLGPEEFKLEENSEGRFQSIRRTPAKV